MVNEMGNTNSSVDQENAAVDVQQKGEATGNVDGVKEENNITPEGESKENHEKDAALPTFDTSTDKEPQLKNSEDDKADEDKGDTQIKQLYQCSEVQTDANDLSSEVTNIETYTSQYGQKVDQLLEEDEEVHDQTCNKKGEAEGSLSNDEVLKSDPVESSSAATDTVEEHFNSSPSEEQDTSEKGRSEQNEDKTQLISSEISLADKTIVADGNDQNVITQQDECLVGELDATGDMSNEEKHENTSAENQVDLDETPKVESSPSDATGSLLADSPRITPSSSFPSVVEPQDKSRIHTPETELTSRESENVVKKCDLKGTESFMQEVHEMQNDNSGPSVESHPIEVTEEKLSGNNTNTDGVMDYSIEEDKARGNINVQPDILYHDHAPPEEQHMNFEETFEMVPEIGVLPTKFIVTTTEENGFLEKEKVEVEKPSREEIREECILHLGPSKPENGINIAYGDGRVQGFESVEDQKERNADLTEHDNFEFIVTEDSGVFELNISEKETENAQNVQTSLEALAFSNGKCTFDQKVPNFHYETPSKAPESIGRLSLETIPERSSNGTELRKSPSFDFGVHRRSSESDQTPLLCPEKTPTRSLSVGSNAKFSNSITRTGYNRNSLDYEAVTVEEKTIRVERSDSDISSTPLLGLSNKGENGDLKVTSETQQNHVAVTKREDFHASQEKETCLTSPKGSGKRKPRPSFFTTCICCTAATHY